MDDTTDGPALEPLPKTYRKTPALSTYRCRICKSDKHRPWFVLVEDESYLLCGLCHRKESELSLVAAPQPAMPVPSPNPMQESTLVEAQASNQGQARVRGARKHRSQKKQKQVAPLKIGIVPRGGKSNVTARPSPHAQLTQATVRRRRSKRGHEAAVKALDISPSPSNFVGGSVLPEVHLGEPLVGAQNLDATGQSVGQQESAPAEGGETRGEGKLEEGGESDPVVMEENMRGALGTAEERGVSSGARRGRWRSRKSRDSAGAGSGLLTSAGGAPVYGGAEGPVTMSKQGTVGENKDRDGKIGALSETDGASAKPVSAGPAEGPVLNDEKRCADCGRTASKRWREDVKGGVKCEKCNKQGNEKSGGARPGRSAENGHVSCDEVDLRTPGSSVQKPVQAAKERGGSRGKEEEGGKRKLSFGEAEPPRKRQKAAAAEAEVGGVGLDGELVNRRVGIWWPLDKVYYPGQVVQYKSENRTHEVLYDDGERETVNLLTESWKLSDDEAKCGSDGKSRGGDREVPGYKERVSIEPVREGVTNGRQPRDDVAASGAGQANGSAKRIKVCPKRQREEGKSAGGKRESRRRVSGRGKATMGAGLVGGEAEPVSATEGGSGGTLGAGPTDPPPAEHLEIVRDVLKMVAEVKERGGVSDGTVSAWEKGSGAEAGESENGKGGAVASGAEKRCGAVDPGVAGGETGPETLPSEELPFAGQAKACLAPSVRFDRPAVKAISGRLSKEAEPSPDEVGRESRPPAVTGTRAVSEASRSAILDGGAGSALADQPGNCKQGNGKEAEVAGKSRKDGRKRGRAAEQGSASVHESASLAGKEKPGIVSPAERAGEEKLGGFAADPGLNDGVAPLARFDGDEGAMVRFSAVEAGAEAKVRNEAKSSDARRASAQGLNGEASARGAEQPVEAGNSISTVGTEMNSIADGKAKEPNVVAPGAVESEAGNVDGAVEAMAFGTVRRAEITDDGMPAARMDEVGEIADVPARGGTDVALGVGAERPIERSDDVRSDGGAGYEMGEEAAMTEAGRDGREAAGGRADVTAECDKKERESAGEKTPLKNLLADIEREIRERERAIWESAPPGERLPLQDWGGVLVDEIADVTEKRDGEGGAGFGPTGGEQMRGSGPSGARPEEEMDVPESMPPKGEREPRQTAARNEVMSGSGTRVVAVTGDVDGEFVVRSGAETGVREAEGISRDERRTTAGLSSPPNNHQNRAASGENGKESVQESEKTDARALQPEFGLPPPESEHTQVPQQLTEGITDGEGAKSSESGDATCQTKRPEIGSLWAACAQQIQSAPDFPLPTTHPATISASESGGRSEPRAGGGSAASARGPLERSGEPPGGILESLAGVVSALKGAIRATQEGGRVIGAGLETLLQALEPLEQGALRLGPGVEGAAAFCVRGLSSRGVAECAFGPTSPGRRLSVRVFSGRIGMEIFLPHPVKSLRVTEAYKRKALFRIKVARPNTWRPLLPSENRCSSCICLLVDKIERENSVTEQPKSNL